MEIWETMGCYIFLEDMTKIFPPEKYPFNPAHSTGPRGVYCAQTCLT